MLLTNSGHSNIKNNIKDSLYLLELTEADLIEMINNMKNKKSTGLHGMSSSERSVLSVLLTTYLNHICIN